MKTFSTQTYAVSQFLDSFDQFDTGAGDSRLKNALRLEETNRILVDAENSLRFAVGRFIHDNSQQQLQMALSMLRYQAELLQHDPEAAISMIAETNQRLHSLLDQANNELSLLRREIQPALPHIGALHTALRLYLIDDVPRLFPDATFSITADLDILELLYDEEPANSHMSEKMLIAYFVREGVRNAYKHAAAKRIKISASPVSYPPQLGPKSVEARSPGYSPSGPFGEYVCITIEDDGRGFDLTLLPDRPRDGQHCSFYEFAARTAMLNGFTHLESRVGRGTRWELYLPVQSMAVTQQTQRSA